MTSAVPDSNLQIVTTPTIEWLTNCARDCNSRVIIASPYVNDGILQITKSLNPSLSRTLVTRTDLRDFAIGSSNLNTLCTLAGDGFVVRSLSDLHAKIYIFDNSSALVTSANATFSGLSRNWECGFGTNNPAVVTRLARSLMRGLGAERPPRIARLGELESLRIPLEVIKATLPTSVDILEPAARAPSPDVNFSVADDEALLRGFRGWRRLTLQGVMTMPDDGFRMDDLLRECANEAKRRYPRNYNVAAKLRQQLQDLRELGFVEFVDYRGLYRYTMKEPNN